MDGRFDPRILHGDGRLLPGFDHQLRGHGDPVPGLVTSLPFDPLLSDGLARCVVVATEMP